MIKSPRTSGEFENVLLMQRLFPNLANGFSEGLSYREIAQKIVDFDEKDHPFRNFSHQTVVKYVAWALRGFEFEGIYYDGLREDEVEENIRIKAKRIAKENSGFLLQHTSWSDDELMFVKNLYVQGISPKEISRRYAKSNTFTQRTCEAIESQIYALRKRGEIIQHQRINWDSDLGFTALALVAMYEREGNFAQQIRTELNYFYYNGEERITKSIFDNFLKRNKATLESILVENGDFKRRNIS